MRKILLVFLLVGGVASAQEPEPESYIAIFGGGATVIDNTGEDEEFVSARIAVRAKASEKFDVVARGTLLRVQDGGTLDVPDPATFRAVEVAAGVSYDLVGKLSLVALGGFTLSAEGSEDAPSDARLFTVAGAIRYALANDGYIYGWVGHHDPVGGPAFGVSASLGVGDTGAVLFADYAFPLDRNVLRDRTYTLTTGVLVPLGKWGL